MNDFTSHGMSLPEAYHEALLCLYKCGDVVNCPDYNTTQKELSMTMKVIEPLAEPMISKMIPCGPRELMQYEMEMLDGILDFEVEKGKWSYTYHQRMAVQFGFIISELTRNPDSRRACIVVRDKEADMDSTDPACLQHIQYFIRDGKLHCKVLFRSNDAVKATFMNAYALIRLQQQFARALGVEMGTYVHRANSFHVYERDFDLLESYVERCLLTEDKDELAYNYEGDWEELMLHEVPKILADVEKLKER